MRSKSMGRWFWIILIVVVVPGCGDDATPPPLAPAESFREIWQGSWLSQDQSDRGTLILDVVRTGAHVTGDIVFRSYVSGDYRQLYLKGLSGGDDLRLHLDTGKIPYQFEFTLQGAYGSSGDLTATFFYSVEDLRADVDGHVLEMGTLAVQDSFYLNTTVLGLAFDGERVWISTASDDFVRMSPDGTLLDQIVVWFRGQYHYQSDALTSDGIRLWGHLPVQIVTPYGTSYESDIEEFTKDGVITRDFRLSHRTSGLASDGDDLWSLPLESDGFYRFDKDGTILEKVAVQLPDLVDIEYDGTHFWSIGWFTKKLYEIDRTGEVVRAYDLPEAGSVNYPSAIVFDGTYFWYSFSTLDLESGLYRLSVSP
jgi:hypothetical protein